jgi:SAM-dependent methyltransferase
MEQYNDIQGHAIYDYWKTGKAASLKVHNSYGVPEKMPVRSFFKSYQELPEIERFALDICEEEILDVGAGAGRHALILQEMQKKVTALEMSPLSAEVMRQRGVKEVIEQDLFCFENYKFMTILMLMNGIGLSGTIQGLENMLEYMKGLLHPEGQWIFDSSDISYLYAKGKKPNDYYYGEIKYQFEYKRLKGSWFNWLYIDKKKLTQLAKKSGWHCQVIYENDQDEFLTRLTLS